MLSYTYALGMAQIFSTIVVEINRTFNQFCTRLFQISKFVWPPDRVMATQLKTRSTPREQTSAVPCVNSMKQPSQVWNSLPNRLFCHVWHILKVPWKYVPPPSYCWQTQIRKNPLSTDLNATCPNCSRLFFMWYLTYLENVMKIHSFIFHNVVKRHDAAPRVGTLKVSCQTWNSLSNCFIVSR